MFDIWGNVLDGTWHFLGIFRERLGLWTGERWVFWPCWARLQVSFFAVLEWWDYLILPAFYFNYDQWGTALSHINIIISLLHLGMDQNLFKTHLCWEDKNLSIARSLSISLRMTLGKAQKSMYLFFVIPKSIKVDGHLQKILLIWWWWWWWSWFFHLFGDNGRGLHCFNYGNVYGTVCAVMFFLVAG